MTLAHNLESRVKWEQLRGSHMKRATATLLFAVIGTASLPSYALDITQAARFGASAGRYEGEAKADVFDSGGALFGSADQTTVRFTYGGALGYALGVGDFY